MEKCIDCQLRLAISATRILVLKVNGVSERSNPKQNKAKIKLEFKQQFLMKQNSKNNYTSLW